MIKNEEFWQYWREGQFKEAMQCDLQQTTKKRGARLFQKATSTSSTIIGISAGEFLYDYLMIDPTVVKGLDFARTEDLQNLFQLATFADTVDLTKVTGDMAQLQGYVAEQMIAQELTAAGHDVQFPETSNQAGWDIIVDGDLFQVKCGASKQIVDTHFEKYPDIPVYVNAELAHHYEGNPLVLSTSITHEQVLAETTKTLEHAGDLLDFEIPWIAAGVSAFQNVKRMRIEQLQLSTAARNVVADTASRSAMAAVGKVVIGGAGTLLMPGAGAIFFPVVGAYVGVTQGGKVSALLKKQFAKAEYAQLCSSLQQLIQRMQTVLSKKSHIKETKWQQLSNQLPMKVAFAFHDTHADRTTLIENIKRELQSIEKVIEKDALAAFEHIITVLGKAGIHMYSLKDELAEVQRAFEQYGRRM
ncbi:MAG: hypothetical protein RR595_14620 [Lysinibacillus sp.]